MLRGDLVDPVNMLAVSRLHGMVPCPERSAVREYSDMQLGVQHIPPTL